MPFVRLCIYYERNKRRFQWHQEESRRLCTALRWCGCCCCFGWNQFVIRSGVARRNMYHSVRSIRKWWLGHRVSVSVSDRLWWLPLSHCDQIISRPAMNENDAWLWICRHHENYKMTAIPSSHAIPSHLEKKENDEKENPFNAGEKGSLVSFLHFSHIHDGGTAIAICVWCTCTMYVCTYCI